MGRKKSMMIYNKVTIYNRYTILRKPNNAVTWILGSGAKGENCSSTIVSKISPFDIVTLNNNVSFGLNLTVCDDPPPTLMK